MKQCLRAHRMQVLPACSVAELCSRIPSADAALVGVAGAPPLQQHVAAAAALHRDGALVGSGTGPARQRGLLIIGPEGDFTPEELAALLAAGAAPVGLGPLRLRAETAAVSILAYLQLHFDGPDSRDSAE